MATTDKDIIYIDIDDEITGIIDKLRASDGKVVALVLPKRATVFQSIVNMKLLKRAAGNEAKHLILITTEAGLLPLAGAAGIHTAKTLTSKPEIPSAPQAFDDKDETIDEATAEPAIDPKQPVGALAASRAAKPVTAADGVETLVLDDDDIPPEADDKPAGPKTFEPPKDKKKPKKNKKLAVPNFERFRLLLILGGVLLLAGIGVFAYLTFATPKATISIKTDASNIDVDLSLALSTAAKTVTASTGTIPAKLATQQKTYTQQVPTTGQKNNGNKASGTVVVNNCSRNEGDITIPAGTGFSSSGNTYISQESVTVPESSFTGGDKCKNNSKASVSVIAQSPGTSYNLPANSTYTISVGISGLTGNGNTMSGGTDNIVKSVNQNDINNAKAKIAADTSMKQTLLTQLKSDGYRALDDSYTASAPTVTTSTDVGQVADNVTVTQTVAYTMFGYKQDDLRKLVTGEVDGQIDTDKQAILDDGLSTAKFTVDNLTATDAKVSMSTKATVGPDLNVDTIREQAAGQKAGQIKSDLTGTPGVKDVTVKISPFWISSVPKKTERITVDIAKPDANPGNTSDSNGDNP